MPWYWMPFLQQRMRAAPVRASSQHSSSAEGYFAVTTSATCRPRCWGWRQQQQPDNAGVQLPAAPARHHWRRGNIPSFWPFPVSVQVTVPPRGRRSEHVGKQSSGSEAPGWIFAKTTIWLVASPPRFARPAVGRFDCRQLLQSLWLRL